ncbi:MAG: DUF1616 domain-containing protein [Candidatus Bathyarchaeia archaeon]
MGDQDGPIWIHSSTSLIDIAIAEGILPLNSDKLDNSSSPSIEELVLEYVAENKTPSVQQIFDVLRSKRPSVTKTQLTALLRSLHEQGKIELEDVSLPSMSFGAYLLLWDRNRWFYASLIISIFTLFLVYVVPSEMPFLALRWVCGSLFVLLIPGYVTLEALYPRKGVLNSFQRFTLGFGLSLALVPLVALILNYTPWGIRLTPIIISLTILTLGLSGIALARHYLSP